MLILGLETSCDDTCCALLEAGKSGFKVLSNIVSSQVKVHAPYGGVVPALAAREHTKNILPCLKMCLGRNKSRLARITMQACAPLVKDIDLIAVTVGPGLSPSLLVGVSAAKALAYTWQKPVLAINHLEAHIAANFIGKNSQRIRFPALCLVVSGGHTLLVLMRNYGDYQLLGQTRDDAAGEAFDKIARLLGLDYPGGPAVAAEAAKFKACPLQKQRVKSSKLALCEGTGLALCEGTGLKVKLPRPMLHSKNYDFSFSGLKTAVLYHFKNQPAILRGSKQYIQYLCVEVQQAIVEVLAEKTIKAAREFQAKTVMLAGGVAANQCLRRYFYDRMKFVPQMRLFIPEIRFCTDNALMVTLAAYFKISRQNVPLTRGHWQKLEIVPNLELT